MAAIHAPAPAPTPPPPPHSHQEQVSSRSGSIDVGDMIMALIPPPHAHHQYHTTAGSGGPMNNNSNNDSRKPFATPSTPTTNTNSITTAFMNNRRCSISALFAATPTSLSYNPDILDNLNFHSTSRPRRPSFSGTFNLNGIDLIPPSTLAEAQASLVGTDHLDSALECCNVYFPSFYELLEHYETVHVEIGRDIFSTLPKLDPIQEMDESGSLSATGTMGAHGTGTTTSTTTSTGMTNAFPSPALSHRSSTTTATTTTKSTHPNTVDPSGVSHIQEGLRHLRLEHPSANNNYLVPYSTTATQNPQDPLPQTTTTTKRPRTLSLNAANQPDEFKKVRSATTKAPALDCVPDSPIGGDFEPSRPMAIPVPSHPHSVPSHPHSVPSSGVPGTPPPVGGRGNGQTPITPPMDYHSPRHHHPHPQHHGQEAASPYSPARSMHRHSHSHSAAFAIAPEVLHPQPRHRYPHPSAPHADISQQHNGSMPNISFLEAHPHLYDMDRSSTPQPHLSYSGAHLPVRPDSAPPVYAPNAELAFLEGMYDHQFEHDFEYEYDQSLAGSSPMMSNGNMHRNSPSVGPKSLHHPHMNMGMPSTPSTSATTTTTGHTQQHVNDFSQHATIDPVTNKKQYKCPKPLCSKVYKNSNGLKYHLEHGNCEIEYTKPMHNGSSSTPNGVGNGSSSSTGGSSSPPHPHMPFMYNTMNGVLPPLNMNLNGVNLSVPFLGDIKIAMRPYWCRVEGCGKKYKNLNGLKYHAKVVHPHMDFRKEVKGHASMGL
ncbi:hypothetical protein HDU85_005720 [Gaertneriomyces sp. JEL0708]|nr:hypothetical protein HDU85_005720 [Gaertneriomyces sp. JEL0708]